eukprot:12927189-Prorocentrum_lima.AAC.1
MEVTGKSSVFNRVIQPDEIACQSAYYATVHGGLLTTQDGRCLWLATDKSFFCLPKLFYVDYEQL